MTTDDNSDDVLARDWWEYHRLARGSREDRKGLERGEPAGACAARWAVNARVEAGGVAAVELVHALCRAEPVNDEGMTVGCGPLEDLVHEHGDDVIDEIEQRARLFPEFARALSHVWLEDGHVSEGTAVRLRRWIASS